MAVSKRERIEKFLKEMSDAHPFSSLDEARSALEVIMRRIEDELSGVVEDPLADEKSVSDGRMYPPTNRRELAQETPLVRKFRHIGHKTCFGLNGAILIEPLDGPPVLNLPGSDGRYVSDLLQEKTK